MPAAQTRKTEPCAVPPIHPFDGAVGALTLKHVVTLTTLSRAHLYTLIARGEFPSPAKVGRKSIGSRLRSAPGSSSASPNAQSQRRRRQPTSGSALAPGEGRDAASPERRFKGRQRERGLREQRRRSPPKRFLSTAALGQEACNGRLAEDFLRSHTVA